MPGAAPGSNSRGRGGKFKKFTRGGGKHFSRDLRPLDADGNEISMWAAGDARGNPAEQESDEEEDSEEESSEEDEDGKAKEPQSREERKQAAKARKEAAIARKKAQAVEVGDMPPTDSEEEESDGDMPANPNHSKAARNQTKPAATVESVTNDVAKLTTTAGNRKERESAEAALAREQYRKLHEQGKTDEAKADMARLKLIREQRDAEAARRQAEKEERDEEAKTRRAEIEAKEAKKREAALGKKPKKSK